MPVVEGWNASQAGASIKCDFKVSTRELPKPSAPVKAQKAV